MNESPPRNYGLKLANQYTVHRRLAQSLFGCVYLCEHNPTSKFVALKRISLESASAQLTLHTRTKVQEDVHFELYMHRTLQSPRYKYGSEHILELIEDITFEGHLYIVTEYCAQGELYSIIEDYFTKKRSFCNFNELCVQYFKQIVSGVSFLHANNFAHRDLSLENVLITADGVCKLCDFGLAAYANSVCTESVGKAFYMAPEVVRNEEYDPAKADIWSLGIMLFIMLTGSPPLKSAENDDPRYQVLVRLGVSPLLKMWKLEKVSELAIDLMDKILCEEPKKRMSVEDILQHPFLAV